MDAPLATAARALASGDPLGALHHVALRGDPRWRCAASPWPSWAIWNAPARCGARPFRPEQELARARCELAEADVALAMRDLDWPDETLESTRQALLRHGDLANAAHARLLHARRLLLGRADDAAVAIAGWDQAPLPPPRGRCMPAAAGIALRRLQAEPARLALAQARTAARASGIDSLQAEADTLSRLRPRRPG